MPSIKVLILFATPTVNHMLTYEDCLGLCHLTDEEIHSIAEHEGLPRLVALAHAEYLLHTDTGVPVLRKIIVDDIELARKSNDLAKVRLLEAVLKHFVLTHPEHPQQNGATRESATS